MRKVKFLVLSLLVAVVAITQVKAQKSDADVTVTKVLDISADKVWSKLRQMDDIDKYSSAIAKVDWTGNHGVGGQRVCTTPDGKGFFKESIVGFDDTERSYTYAVVEGVPVKGLVNSFKVVDLGYNKSMVVWTSNYDQFITNPNMSEEQFLGFMNQSINEMISKISSAAAKS
ncbi:MAG: SRPBCC family protein [Bacteroidota bacterium]